MLLLRSFVFIQPYHIETTEKKCTIDNDVYTISQVTSLLTSILFQSHEQGHEGDHGKLCRHCGKYQSFIQYINNYFFGNSKIGNHFIYHLVDLPSGIASIFLKPPIFS